MTDIAELALRVDALEVKAANAELDRMSVASRKVDKDVDQFATNANSKLASITRSLGLVAAGFVSLSTVRSLLDASIQLEKFNNALQVATGSSKGAAEEMAFVRAEADRLGLDLQSAAEQYSRLAAAAKGTELQGQSTRDIFVSVAQAATVMGLSAAETGGALTALEQIISKGKVSAEELRGQLGERLPGAFQIAARSIGVTTAELDKLLSTGNLTAEQLLPALAAELNRTFGPQAEQAAQGLNAQINRFNTAVFNLKIAIGELGLIELFNAGIQVVTSFVNVINTRLLPAVKSVAEFINSIPVVSTVVKAAFGGGWLATVKSANAETQALNTNLAQTENIARAINIEAPVIKAAKATRTLNKELNDQKREAERTADEIKRLTREYDPLFKRNEELARLIELRAKGLPESIFNSAAAAAINDYIAAIGKTEVAIEKISTAEQTVLDKTREFWDTNEQIWIQGVRNVQTSLANGLFNVFDDGLKGMVNGVKRAVGQMIAEFASIKILQGTGIAGLLGLGSTAAFASGGAASGGGLSALNIASLGSGALNLVQSGFGLTGAIGGGLQSLGGSIGSNSLFQFGAGVGGDLLGAGIGTAGSLGAGLGALAGPAAIAGIADIGLRQLFGDKKLGGTAGDILSYVPVVGTLINGLFGRGAPKFQNEALVGNVSAGGFDGVLNQAFREKGGVFRSNRTSNFIADTDTGNLLNQFGRLSESGNIPGALRDSATDQAVKRALEVGKFLDEAFGGIGDTLKQTAEKLGLSSDALNNFNIELDLVSEKGETLSEAQISEEITRISDAMIATLIPNLDELAKKGETSADTLNRLNTQFSVLESAAMLFGNTAEQAAEKVRALGIDGQTAFIDSIGGVDVAAAEISEFYNNVFTDAQKLEVTKNQILGVLRPLGIDFIPTLDQLYDAVASGNPQLIQAALKIDGLVTEFDRLNASLVDVADPIKEIVDAVDDLAARQGAALRVAEKASRAERQKAESEKFAAELDAIKAIKTEAESLRDTFLRSGDVAGAIMNELKIISESIEFTSAGAFNAGLAKQIADASQTVANRASVNALRVPDVSGFMNAALGNIVSDSIVTPIYLSIRDAIVDGSGDMSNAVRDSVDGFAKTFAQEQARLSRAPRGRGIANVLSAQSDLSFVSAAGFSGGQKQFGRDVLAYGEAIRRLDDRLSDGQITLTEYDGAIAGLNDVMGGAAKLFGDVESQFERIKNSGLALASSGINAIGFYFNDITKQVAELNKQAAESGLAIAQTTDAIGRLESASFVFGQSVSAVFSGNAAAGISFAGSPETDKAALIGQAAGIAAQVLTTADAAKFAQQLASEEAFSGLGNTGLRDISLLLDGLKAFDPASFENAFLRINDALITGAVTQEQYNVLFNTALDEFEGLGTSAGGAKSALGQLREAARNLADELLLGDKSILNVFQKTSEAQRQYNEVIERARSGNATSSELSSGVNNLLDAQLNSASTKFEFDRQFATVINDLQSIGGSAEDRRLAEQKKSTEELKAEIKKLREDLNAANVAIAKSTAKTADVLNRWSVVGLPATEA